MHADFPSGPAVSTLSTSLISFWKMDETSGSRYDAVSGYTLTDNNTVGYATGKNGNAGDFEYANSEMLYRADNAALSFNANENFTIACWINLESATTYRPIISKNNGLEESGVEYNLSLYNSEPYLSTGNGTAATYVDWGATLSTGTWYMLCAWYNTTTDSIYIQVNNGMPIRALAVYEPFDGGGDFHIGAWTYSNYFMDGLIDDVGIWGRAGNAVTGKAMADSIYNSGNGWRP